MPLFFEILMIKVILPWCQGISVATLFGVFVLRFHTGCPAISGPINCSIMFKSLGFDHSFWKAWQKNFIKEFFIIRYRVNANFLFFNNTPSGGGSFHLLKWFKYLANYFEIFIYNLFLIRIFYSTVENFK